MDIQRVKKKLPLSVVLTVLAASTFLASLGQLFPSQLVEDAYSRGIFPTISHVFGFVADVLPFSWLDIWIVGLTVLFIYALSRRRWRLLAGAASAFYLWFFWGWGLNYHRPPLENRLHLDRAELKKADFDRFAGTVVEQINRLWPLASEAPLDRGTISAMASKRVRRVVLEIDGQDWPATARIKRSLLAEPWYRIAGIDGMFNPFGHEPLVVEGPLPFELPFLMAHEIAHVRGVANEGEANLVALLATITSDDPRFQYSGWLYLWGYVWTPNLQLDPGPQADVRKAAERALAHRIQFITQVQSVLLDAHLKANRVPGGIRSYSDFVALAIASQPRWQDFR